MCHNLIVHLLINRVKGWGFGGEVHPRLVVISITFMSTYSARICHNNFEVSLGLDSSGDRP